MLVDFSLSMAIIANSRYNAGDLAKEVRLHRVFYSGWIVGFMRADVPE